MKRKTCLLPIAALILIAIVGGCDTGADTPVPPLAFAGTWSDPEWFDVYAEHSRFYIFRHEPDQKIPAAIANYLGLGNADYYYRIPRVFTVNPDWTFTYSGGFSQVKIENLVQYSGPILYPRLVVKGKIAWAEDQFYTITPTSAIVDLTEISALAGDNQSLPPETVASFEEYAKISVMGGKLIIDDMPRSITNAKGILRGIWTKQ